MYILENLYLYYTWQCNLSCKHCWVSAGQNQSSSLKPKDAYNACMEAIELGLKNVKFTGGEPLLFAEEILPLAEILKHTYGINVHLETNGTLISTELSKKIKHSFSSVSVSLDHYDEEKHNEQRCNELSFRRTLSGLTHLLEQDVSVSVISVLRGNSLSENCSYIDQLIVFLKRMGIQNLKLNPIMNIGRAHVENAPTYNMLAEDILTMQSKYCKKHDDLKVSIMVPCAYQIDITNPSNSCIQTCHSLSLLSILPNGDVGLCGESKDIKEFKFGNVKNMSLREIWNCSKSIQNLREKINCGNGLVGACEKCLIKNMCIGSCRIDGYLTGGSINSAPYICQEMFSQGKFHLLTSE